MSKKAEELYREALALSEEEREELVRLLTIQRDSGFASPAIEQAWMEESDRRYQEWQDGKVEATPAEVVHRRVRQRLTK